jgi:hypothetical protein
VVFRPCFPTGLAFSSMIYKFFLLDTGEVVNRHISEILTTKDIENFRKTLEELTAQDPG